ncbi:MAG: GrpB family protein [Dehalococcoidales bacterium]
METQDERVARVVAEDVAITAYDAAWPRMFEAEKRHLRACLPGHLIGRIEHFGSTAVPGLAAKPIVDMLVEVTSLPETRETAPAILLPPVYDYFWRALFNEYVPPFYAFFIKRDSEGQRSHHIHIIEADSELWDRLLLRDYLIEHPEVAKEYADLKLQLAANHAGDRIAYTMAKTEFIVRVTATAKAHYR